MICNIRFEGVFLTWLAIYLCVVHLWPYQQAVLDTAVTYPVSLTSFFCVPSCLPTCDHFCLPSINSSCTSSSSSSSRSPASLLWLRTKLTGQSSQLEVNGCVNFVLRPPLCTFLPFGSQLLPLYLHLSTCVDFASLLLSIIAHRSALPLCWTLLCNGCSLADLLPPVLLPLPHLSPLPPPLMRSLSGRSALHWACSVNHLSLARTLIRYGAAVDLQDNKVNPGSILKHLKGFRFFGALPATPNYDI